MTENVDLAKMADEVLAEDARRLAVASRRFDPVTGEGGDGERVVLDLEDYPLKRQWVPRAMAGTELVRGLMKAGSVEGYVRDELGVEGEGVARAVGLTGEALMRLRAREDFAFWAAVFVYIKNKGGGDDVLLRLTSAQRLIVERFEAARRAGRPIRLLLLKARQLGGSTVIQMYMAWLQLMHRRGLNSLIISLQGKASDEIFDMYDRMIKAYPLSLLHELGEAYQPGEAKWAGVGTTGAIHRVPQRNCKIKLGSAERPDSCRGGDYSLVHLSEVGLWKKTEGKTPEDIVQSACSGVLLEPMTMIVYESTARGTGNFFHREYAAAKAGKSQFEALFIPWWRIPQWSAGFGSEGERRAFARELVAHREERAAVDERHEPGSYLWWLWGLGATLEAIHWYVAERSGRSGHSKMSSEYPSDDVEAFADIDNAEFDRYQVEALRPSCRAPKWRGELSGEGTEGEAALRGLTFAEGGDGCLWVWSRPEIDDREEVTDRYLVVVDIGGRSDKADWSVVCVFDRVMMMDGGKPAVVAQWYGHTDMDVLAWKAAQIAAWYDDALLVIESNTLETRDRERMVDGEQSLFILDLVRDVYPNLYARRQSADDIRAGMPRKYGFHTNVSTKPMVISMLKRCVRERLYVERDARCLHELLVYERKANGAYGAIAGEHDDLLMTRAIGLWVCFREMEVPSVVARGGGGRRRGERTVGLASM